MKHVNDQWSMWTGNVNEAHEWNKTIRNVNRMLLFLIHISFTCDIPIRHPWRMSIWYCAWEIGISDGHISFTCDSPIPHSHVRRWDTHVSHTRIYPSVRSYHFVHEGSISEGRHSSCDILGCNNGGGGGIFPNVKRSVWKCIGTRKRSLSGFLVCHVGFWKGSNFSPEIILPIKPLRHICPCPWAVEISKKIWFSDLFWAGDGRFCGDFPPFCILASWVQTCQFFNGT